MALQILPRSQGFGELLGQNLGSGLGALATYKLDQLNQNRAVDRLKKLGVSDEEADYIASLPQKYQLQALGMLSGGSQEQQQDTSIQNMLQQLAPPQQQQQTPQPQMGGMGNLSALQNLPIAELLAQLQGKPTQASPVIQQQAQQSALPPQEQPVQQQIAKPVVQEPVAKKPAEQPKAIARAKSALIGNIKNIKDSKDFRDQQKAIDKETLPLYEKIVAEKDVADASAKRLGKMETLINKGDLPPAALYRFIKNLEENVSSTSGAAVGGGIGALAAGPFGAAVGAGIGGLISPIASALKSVESGLFQNTEEFEKLSTDFIRDAKSIFGNRITDADLQVFLQMIPTLSQTDTGKKAIINNLKMFNEAAQVKYKNMKKLIHANGGKRPENLALLLEEFSKPELDVLSKAFQAA